MKVEMNMISRNNIKLQITEIIKVIMELKNMKVMVFKMIEMKILIVEFDDKKEVQDEDDD